jgi:hypothetical protein
MFLKDQFLILYCSLFTLMICLKVLIQNALVILFAYDTSVHVTDSNIVGFWLDMKIVHEQWHDWFNVILLLLNFERTV